MRDRRAKGPGVLPWIRGLAVGLTTCALVSCGERSRSPLRPLAGQARGDNVLLVTLDTTRADRLGCYGYQAAQTPVLDRLAREGVRVQRALTVTPVTLPSHTSILSGQLPVEHGVHDNGLFEVGDATPLLAPLLAEQGYTTAAFVSAYVLDSVYGIGRGFERFDDRMPSEGGRGIGPVERPAVLTVDAAVQWLEESQPEPWFVWVHLYDPHFPYQPAAPFDALPDPYDGEIAYADSELGRLLEAWDVGDRLQRTLVAVTADHGEGLGSHGENTHGVFVYDSTLWVPLILRHPALGSGRVLDGQVSVTDLAPTLLELLGLPVPPAMSGASFLLALEQDTPEVWHDAHFENLSGYYSYGIAALEGVCDDEHKYIHAPREELYAWRQDPAELRNRLEDGGASGADAEVAARLREQWRSRRTVDPLTQGPNREVSAEESVRLAELGYVQDAGAATLLDPKDYVKLQARVQQAEDAAARGRLAEAEGILRALLQTLPNDTYSLRGLGRVCLMTGRREEGVKLLQRALAMRADDFVSAQLLGDAMREDGRPREALAYYEQALHHDPCNVPIALEAARLAVRMKEWSRARRALQSLTDLELASADRRAHDELQAAIADAAAGGRP